MTSEAPSTSAPTPAIALSGTAHDRVAERRRDPHWLAQAWADPRCRVLVLAGSRLRARDGQVAWLGVDETPAGLRALLGSTDDGPRFALLGAEDLAADPSDEDEFVGLRSILLGLGADADLVVHAVGLAEWHRAVRFCPFCGHGLEDRQSGHVLGCPACGREQFPRTDPAVIMLVTDDQDRALLGRQPGWPPARWSTLAGFVEPGESLEAAVRREVGEESGVEVGPVTYFGSQPWPLPASLMLGFTAQATRADIAVDGDELEQARWWSRAEVRRATADGTLEFPPGISISRTLITHWYGEDLPGSWTR